MPFLMALGGLILTLSGVFLVAAIGVYLYNDYQDYCATQIKQNKYGTMDDFE